MTKNISKIYFQQKINRKIITGILAFYTKRKFCTHIHLFPSFALKGVETVVFL